VPPGLPRFAAALRELASHQDVDETLQLAVDLAAELIPGCAVADIMFTRRGGVTTPVATDPRAQALDDLQELTGEGPCLTAAHDQASVVSPDLAHDDRWPEFGARAADLGVRSAASFQLFLHRHEGDRLGALNLYGGQVEDLDAASVQLGELFAAHCAAVLAAAITREGFVAALESRDLIGQAKGILMERHHVTAHGAFVLLRRSSQEHNVKLREVAEIVARTGRLL
jgi:GAF domain-containing protein